MKHFLRTLVLLLAALLPMTGVRASSGQLYSSDKLSSGLITCLCQDRNGFIWIGTEYGLNKFDGYRYTTYFYNHNDSTTLTDNEVSTLFVDRDGRLWVGCAKGLVYYDAEQDHFCRLHFPDRRKPRVSSLAQTADGRLLIGTAGYGLYSLALSSPSADGSGHAVASRGQAQLHIHYETAFNRRHLDDFYSRMHLDREGNLWRSSHVLTLTRFLLKNGKPVSLRDYPSSCGQPMRFVEHGDQLLVVCRNGIMAYHYSTGELTDADFDLSLLDENVTLEEAHADSIGNLYIATQGGGLMVIRRGSRQLSRVDQTATDIDLRTAAVADVLVDKDHNLWVGCYNKGLMLLSSGQDAFSTWSFSAQRYLMGGGVSSVATGDGGTTYCTVQNSGVYQLGPDGSVVAHPHSPAGTRLIYRDHGGRYWLGTENVLYRYDPSTGQATEELTLSGRGLNAITDDARTGLLYISNYGMGLYVYDPATRQGQQISMRQTHRKGGYLCNDWIKALTFDSRGQLWICTTNGLSVMQPDGFVFNRHGWNALLEGLQCFSVCETGDGNMLIGTEMGLYRYDRRKNQIHKAPQADQLDDKLICAMVLDADRQNVWLSTTYGIWQYNRSHRLIGHVGGNGLSAKEYMLGASLHRADDRIFFGTADGLVTFLPRDVSREVRVPGRVHLTRFAAGGHTLNPFQTHFRLPYTDNTFALEFSLLDFRHAESIAFEWRLRGSDTWNRTSEGVNVLTFNQLQPGDYVLDVRASAGGATSAELTTLHITVLKPWYRSTPAYLAYLLVAAGFLGLLLFNRDRQRRRDLEEQKMRFLINATHDIRSPLTLIMGATKKLKEHYTEELRSSVDTIDKNAQRLLLLVNQILDERKIDKHQMKLSCRETDLVTFVNGIFKLYEYNARERGIDFRFEHPEGLVKVWIDRTQFDKVVSNLLSNAFKYTRSEVLVRIGIEAADRRHPASVTLQVTDNGQGFEDDRTDRFFERFYQGRNSKAVHSPGTGIGLNLCRALTEMHGGTIVASNRKDGQTGAVLTVTLRQGCQHLKPDQLETAPAASPVVEGGARKSASRNLRLLVVDDDVEIAAYIRQELSAWYKFDYAPNGREALKMLLTKTYDLVISDVIMPEMDGIALLRNIKSNTEISDVPVILLTSRAEVDSRLEGLKRGADAYMAKPFSMEELHVTIDNLVDNVRRLRGKFSGVQRQEGTVEPVRVKGNNDLLMERVMRVVNDNLSDPEFGVESLTREVGISRAQLHRKMKELTGISTSDFIRNLRLEQAARLIRERKINVTQVAYSVGFSNQTHFSTIFRRHFGMSPTEYAEKMGEMKQTETQ